MLRIRKDEINVLMHSRVRWLGVEVLYDLVVVGAGPSGCMSAITAASHGLEVLLLEKEEHPRQKLCGGAISPRTYSLLGSDADQLLDRRINAGVFRLPKNRSISCVKPELSAGTVKRSTLDFHLLKKAERAGVEIIQNIPVLAVEQVKKAVRVLAKGDSFRARLLIGADGVNSTVARSLHMHSKWKDDKVALCIAADIPMESSEIERILSIPGDNATLPLEFYPWAIDGGYGWCFPRKDEISIGIGAPMNKIIDLRGAWKGFVSFFEDEKDVKLDLSRRSAARIPLGKIDERLTSRRTMLVGDAAGLVSPLTGEGIYYALRSGIIAGTVAAETIEIRSPLHVVEYDKRIKAEFGTDLSAANFVAGVIYKSLSNIELLIEIVENDPVMKEYIIDFGLGIRPVSNVRKDITKRLLRHHPVKALRLLF